MKLTVEENRESLKRYGHVKPARGAKSICRRLCPGTRRTCSLEKGHRGPHVAHGLFGKVVAVWDLGAADAAPTPIGRLRSPTKRPIGLPSRSPVGILKGVRNFIATTFGSLEEVAWLVFFLAFVGFAVGGFLLVLLG